MSNHLKDAVGVAQRLGSWLTRSGGFAAAAAGGGELAPLLALTAHGVGRATAGSR